MKWKMGLSVILRWYKENAGRRPIPFHCADHSERDIYSQLIYSPNTAYSLPNGLEFRVSTMCRFCKYMILTNECVFIRQGGPLIGIFFFFRLCGSTHFGILCVWLFFFPFRLCHAFIYLRFGSAAHTHNSVELVYECLTANVVFWTEERK